MRKSTASTGSGLSIGNSLRSYASTSAESSSNSSPSEDSGAGSSITSSSMRAIYSRYCGSVLTTAAFMCGTFPVDPYVIAMSSNPLHGYDTHLVSDDYHHPEVVALDVEDDEPSNEADTAVPILDVLRFPPSQLFDFSYPRLNPCACGRVFARKVV